ncbi:TetR/AcrR family transcriptional regulator [Winogradskya consettensis]|uniref:TetR family transcriptional regulator n=1 Tax=Winogradskya consettensis TaxID=113560 RepID=A0A919SU28_9ACTN|nr:TetR/AcrR family transcriptional regulator [Actinoplanes consettensis]GIM77954.1 TetR family transcriptional regulator [Actinoplanes consettensis]
MRQEVKGAALRQLSEGGPAALSLNAIAKELGVSGPALYRYFASRDALLTELILDAYADLALALEGAPPTLADHAAAYRAWALAEPHRYRLLFSAPLPGYDPHDQSLVAAAHRAMTSLLTVTEPHSPVPGPLAAQLSTWSGAEPAVALHAVTAWSRLHGFVTLEIEGNYASMGLDPDELFRTFDL